MCFLPLGCLKFIVGFGAVATIVISLGLLALTVYANIEKKQIIVNTGGKLVTDALVGLYLGATLFMILGICGIYGAIKSRKKEKGSGNCLLFFYFLGIFVFFVAFLGGTIFFFVGPESIFGTDCTHGSKTTLVDDLYNLEKQASSKFCTNDCPCYFNSTNQNSYLANLIVGKGGNITTNNQTHKFYQACLGQDQNQTTQVILMGALQELLHCTGWCPNSSAKFYKFSDINYCVDQNCIESREACHEAFEGFLKGKGQLVGFACIIATVICFINMITVCCICYHPSKTRRGNNFYDRMMDQE